jgi:hypothetical protein
MLYIKVVVEVNYYYDSPTLTCSTITSNAIAFRALAAVTSWLVNTYTNTEIAVFEEFTLINILA